MNELQMMSNTKYTFKALCLRNVEKNGFNEICDSPNHKFMTPPEVLLSYLSFTHIRAILSIDISLPYKTTHFLATNH